MRFLVFYILLLCTGHFVFAQHSIDELLKSHNEEGIPYVSVTEARMFQVNNKAILLDAREIEEFKVSKIPSASYIGYSKFSSEEATKTIKNKEQLIIVYCSIGIRSSTIAKKLKDLGFTNVKNLYGGIFEWKNKGYPILDEDGEETEKVHVVSKIWSKYLEKGVKVM